MTPRNIFVATVAVSLLHGLIPTSPLFLMSYILRRYGYPTSLRDPGVRFYFASLMTATVTLLLSVMPAGLFERFTGRTESDKSPCWSGCGGGAPVISLPGPI